MNDGDDIEMGFLEFSDVFEVINNRILCTKQIDLEVPPQVIGGVLTCFKKHPFYMHIEDSFYEEDAVPVVPFKTQLLASSLHNNWK